MSPESLDHIKSMMDIEIPKHHMDLATPDDIRMLTEYYQRNKKHRNHMYSEDVKRMRIAREIANSYSKDPSSQIGAIAVLKDNTFVTGYNGFPPAISDDYRLYIRALKYKYTIHAEANIIFNDSGKDLSGSSLYVYGLPVCELCAIQLTRAKISKVVMCVAQDMAKWEESFKTTVDIFNEAKIEYGFINKDDLGGLL